MKTYGQATKPHAPPATNGFRMDWKGLATKVVTGDNYFENPDFVKNKPDEETRMPEEPENPDGTGGTEDEEKTPNLTIEYYVKVATYNEETETITSDDPEQETKDVTVYNMKEVQIDYRQLVNGFRMPFDYLWALLVVSEDKDFVFALADLVYDSDVEITIHDNLTVTTNVRTDTYTKTTKVITKDVKVDVNYNASQRTTKTGGPFEGEKDAQYTTTYTNILKANTLNASLTKADVWIADYTQEFTNQEQAPVTSSSESKEDDEEFPATPDKEDSVDAMGFAERFRQEVHDEYSATYPDTTTKITNLKTEYYYKIKDRTITISDTVETQKYIASPAKTIEKTDKESSEDNFVTLFIEYETARKNIISVLEWLVEILENSPDTVDMIDLTRYLIYKATGLDTGVTEYEMEIVDLSSTQKLEGSPLENYIKAWENAILWKYETEQTTYVPLKYITEDGQNYIVYEDGSNGHNNIAYGIATFITDENNIQTKHDPYGDGYYNWKDKFAANDINVEILYEGALVNKDKFTATFQEILAYFENTVEEYLTTHLADYKFSQQQRDSLIAVCYQYGNIAGFEEAYINALNEDDTIDGEKLREWSRFDYSSLSDRKYANYKLFMEEIYTDSSGQEMDFGATDIVSMAKEIHDYMSDPSHLYYYCSIGAENDASKSQHQRAGLRCGLINPFELSKKPGGYGHRLTCCSTYVSWVLDELGYSDSFEMGFVHSPVKIQYNLSRCEGWEEIKNYEELAPGDIVLMYGGNHRRQ